MIVIELTEEEAELLPLLYKVPISNATLETAPQLMRYKLLVDGLIQKVSEAEHKQARPGANQGG